MDGSVAQIDGWKKGLGGWIDKLIDGQIKVRMDGWMDGWMEERIGWMD